jgi:predicted ATPase
LTVLATSREPLGIVGETAWRLPSLALPRGPATPVATGPPDVATLAASEAVRLFVDRARAVRPGFALTARNASAVAGLCLRLDGIPLALELAAAQVRVLPVEQLLSRLDDRFRLLTGGSRTALPRHRTLRAAVDWSHDLLTEPERALFARLSVFAGGFSLEAAEATGAARHDQHQDGQDGRTHHHRRPSQRCPRSMLDEGSHGAQRAAGTGRYRAFTSGNRARNLGAPSCGWVAGSPAPRGDHP